MVKKITFEEVKRRFIEQGREDLEISEDGFNGWKKKSKFYDFVQKEFFYSIPYRVYTDRIVHPKRTTEKRKATLLSKYGVQHQSQLKEVREKISKSHLENFADPKKAKKIKQKRREGCIAKFGVDNAAKSKKVREKIIKTNFERYGVGVPTQSEKIQDKVKKTNLEKYGVDNPMKSERVQKKLRESIQQKYGVDYIGESNIIQKKIKKTLLDRYGTTNSFLISQDNVRIQETDEYISHWLIRQPEPKPSLSTICRYFHAWETISLSDVEKFVQNYNTHKSSLEILTEDLLSTTHFNKEVTKKRYKPDFKLSSTIFLNVDGLYWHSDQQKESCYHLNLRKEFEETGLRIFQFREDEIRDKPKIVKSIVDNALQKSQNKIFARRCKIRSVEQKEATKFLIDNHLMEPINAKHLGLYCENKLVGLLSWKCRKKIVKIERFCSLTNTVVVGGFSKLLSHLEKELLSEEISEIHNWVDLRYGTGNHLLNKGFIQTKETLGWKWTDCVKTYNRLRCKANMDERKLTQQEHADELGWHKIYDAGQRLYVKPRKI